jgi:uroporphyrin-III C-methyltransferase
VAISKATAPEEQIYSSTLAEVEDEGVGPAPVILLIGYAIQIPADRSRVVEELVRL